MWGPGLPLLALSAVTLTSPGFLGAVLRVPQQPDFLGEPQPVNTLPLEQNHCKSNTPGRKKGPDLLTPGLEDAEGTCFPEAKAGSCGSGAAWGPESREAGTRGLCVPREGLTDVCPPSLETNSQPRGKQLKTLEVAATVDISALFVWEEGYSLF